MNILIGKYGRSTYFYKPSDYYNNYGGEDTIAKAYMHLVKCFPQHKFYYIGSNDLDKYIGFLAAKKPSNLIDLDSMIKRYAKDTGKYDTIGKLDESKEPFYHASVDFVDREGLSFDMAFMFYNIKIPVTLYREGYLSQRKKTPLKLLCSNKIPSHIAYLIENKKIPTIFIEDDPRQIGELPHDLSAIKEVWSQTNGTDVSMRFNDDKMTVSPVTVPIRYKQIEKLFLIGKERIDFTNPDCIKVGSETYSKSNEFIMALNGTPSRLGVLDEWIFSRRPNQVIYGKWVGLNDSLDKLIELSGKKENFVEKGMMTMQPDMWKAKYTFVPSVVAEHNNFVTQKIFSMLYFGIIPFWCKSQYDTDNIYKDFPDYIKVSNPDELWNKIDELNSNKEKYVSLLKQLYDLIPESYFDGSIMKDIFSEVLG